MLAEAKASAEYICFKNCMDRGYDFDSAKALSGASDKAALGYLEKWKKEAVKQIKILYPIKGVEDYMGGYIIETIYDKVLRGNV